MANVKISALPNYTGASSDLRWFVMNNSGETTTFKFSGYSSQLIPGTGINFSYRTPNATASGNDSIAIGDTAQATGTFNVAMGYNARATIGNGSIALGWDTIVGDSHAAVGGSHNATGSEGATLGYNNENTGNQSVSIGTLNNIGGGISIGIGYGNTDNSNNRIIGIGGSNNIASAWSVGLGYNNTLVGANFSTESVLIGYGNTINGSGVNTGNINIGQSQTISDGSYNTILNGKSNALQGGNYNTILNGSGNTIGSSYSGVSMFSCFGRTANASNTTYVENIKGFGNFNFGSTNTNTSVTGGVAGGSNNNNSGSDAVILGGNSNTSIGSFGGVVGGYGNNGGSYCGVVGGYGNNNFAEIGFIHGNQNRTEGQTNAILGAEQSKIFSTGYASKHDFIGGGFFNVITDSLRTSIIAGQYNSIISSPESVIIGGTGNTISGITNVVMLGTSGRTATASATTYVENLHIYRTPSTNVQSVVSGTTFTANLELGAKSQFYITGTSTINITNVRDGASFMIKTQTDGNYVMTWTSPGYTFLFSDGGGNPGNNTTDIFVFEVFGSVIYGTRRHNFT